MVSLALNGDLLLLRLSLLSLLIGLEINAVLLRRVSLLAGLLSGLEGVRSRCRVAVRLSIIHLQDVAVCLIAIIEEG